MLCSTSTINKINLSNVISSFISLPFQIFAQKTLQQIKTRRNQQGNNVHLTSHNLRELQKLTNISMTKKRR